MTWLIDQEVTLFFIVFAVIGRAFHCIVAPSEIVPIWDIPTQDAIPGSSNRKYTEMDEMQDNVDSEQIITVLKQKR